MSTHVIRGYHFGYNDETFYVCGSRINSVYDDRSEAETRYRQLEVVNARDANLGEQESLFDGDRKLIAKLDAFVFEKTGEHIADGDYIGDAELPDSLADDDVLRFVEMAQMQAYKLVSFDGAPSFFAVWNCAESTYQMDFDECYEGLVYAESRERALRNLAQYAQDEWEQITLRGSLDRLSESPALLATLIGGSPSLTYNDDTLTLRADRLSVEKLVSLNGLLREPLFEIRELSLAQVQELEQQIGEQY